MSAGVVNEDWGRLLEEPGLRKRPGPALLVWSLPVAETEEEVFVQFAGTV